MIIDSITHLHEYSEDFTYLSQVKSIIDTTDFDSLEDGDYTTKFDHIRYFISTYTLEKESQHIYEVHKKEADIQWVLSGCERIDIGWREPVNVVKEYVPDIYWVEGKESVSVSLDAGKFVLLLPGEPHAPQLIADERTVVRKVVFKIAIN